MTSPEPLSTAAPSVGDPLQRRKLSDEIFQRLKTMITSGELQPGDTLPSERDLMERFAVGRPSVREAMQALSNLGLLSISHGERAKVREITARSIVRQVDVATQIMLTTQPASLDHLKQARRFFEAGMARAAAVAATPEDVAELEALLDRQRDLIGTPEPFIAADMQFHVRIAALSRNPIYEAVSEAMLKWLKHYQTDMLIWSGREHVTLAEHAEIIARIASNDPDGAEAAMIGHIDRSAASYTHPRGSSAPMDD